MTDYVNNSFTFRKVKTICQFINYSNLFDAYIQVIPLWIDQIQNGQPITLTEPLNIKYKFDLPSPEYICYIICKIAKQNKSKKRMKPFFYRLTYLRLSENENLTDELVFTSIFRCHTFKIESVDKSLEYDKWCELKQSFFFLFSYKRGIGLFEKNIIDELVYDDEQNYSVSKPEIVLPKKTYNSVMLNYYKKAMISDDPFIQYLSFYHVLESCYDQVFKEKMIRTIKDTLSHPDFKYNDDEYLFDFAIKIKSFKMDSSNTYPKESEALDFVLKETVDLNNLCDRIKLLNADIKRFNTPVSFFNEADQKNSKLDFDQLLNTKNNSAQTNLMSNLGNRIYATRNALVHSKERADESNYRVFEDEKELRQEIPLIRAVAEQVIIHYSNDLNI